MTFILLFFFRERQVADFGFSKTFELSESATMFTECGTPGYMAPEMMTAKGYDGMAVDLWAAGVILFIMLAGFPPFQRPAADDWWFDKLVKNKHALFWQAHCRSACFSDLTKGTGYVRLASFYSSS